MPSVSIKQKNFMMADLERAKKGEATKTGMSESELKEYSTVKATKPTSKRLTSQLTKNVKHITRYHKKVFRRV